MSNTISNKALKLNPTTSQYSQFLQSFGCERFVYNFYLAEKNSFYEKEIKPLGNDKKARNAVWKTFEETPLAELKKQYPYCLNEHTIEVPKIGKVSFYQNKAPKWYKNRSVVLHFQRLQAMKYMFQYFLKLKLSHRKRNSMTKIKLLDLTLTVGMSHIFMQTYNPIVNRTDTFNFFLRNANI